MEVEKFAKRLRKIMKERNLKQVDILKLVKPYCETYNTKMNKSDISQYLSQKNKPSFEKVYILSKALNVPLLWLNGYGDEEITPEKEKKELGIGISNLLHLLDENKEKLNEAYDKLNEKGQIKAVENIVDLTKIQEYRKENLLESKTIDFEKEKKKRELPYYTIGASAGNGNFLATNDYILIEADEYVPQEANYALCVKGDSMEPKYKNGQMIYVKTQKSVENGEIGIFCLNNDVYVKKFECENGKCMLISLNPAYDPIKINDSDEIMCFGKVLN